MSDVTKEKTVEKAWYVTDFDRIGHNIHGTRDEADQRAKELATWHPGNVIYVLETVGAFFQHNGDAETRSLRLVEREQARS